MDKDLSVINFTNIDSESFEGMWGGKTTIIRAGQTIPLPAFLATHYGNHLADKLLLREQKDFGTEETRKVYLDKILGSISVSPSVSIGEPSRIEDLPIIESEPEFPELPKEEVKEVGSKCEVCGKVVKNEFALRMHRGKFHK